MSEATRILDLDDDGSCEVKLGGQTYWIRQQRRAAIQKVMQAIYKDSATIPETDREYMDFACQQLVDTIPAFAIMLGVEENDSQYADTVAHLTDCLTFSKAQQVFEKWWELNRIEDFLLFGGNPLALQREISERKRLIAERRVANGAAAEVPISATTPISN